MASRQDYRKLCKNGFLSDIILRSLVPNNKRRHTRNTLNPRVVRIDTLTSISVPRESNQRAEISCVELTRSSECRGDRRMNREGK